MGWSADEANNYADELGLIPRDVYTRITANGGQALAEAARIRAAILNIPDRYVNVFVSEVRRDAARASNSTSGYQRADGGWIGAKGYAPGGWVSGPGGGRADKVPAWLSNGEFVVNAGAAMQWAPLLEAINGKGGFTVNMGGINGSSPRQTAAAVVSALKAESVRMGV
jgi:hypothetical protein